MSYTVIWRETSPVYRFVSNGVRHVPSYGDQRPQVHCFMSNGACHVPSYDANNTPGVPFYVERRMSDKGTRKSNEVRSPYMVVENVCTGGTLAV